MTDPVRVGARIEAVSPLGAGLREIVLELDAGVDFLPGQYLQILHPDGAPIPFSIASAPQELPAITLHYLAQPDSDDATRMDALLATGGRVDLLLPCGDCGFRAPLEQPLLMLAGGSGIAQVRSILRSLLPASVPLRLYWGAAAADDLYLAAELDAAAGRHDAFVWIPVAEQAVAGKSSPAARIRRGRVADAVAADIAAGSLDLSAWQVLVAGSPPMVWGSIEVLRPLGLSAEQTRSDVFAYAPRDDLW